MYKNLKGNKGILYTGLTSIVILSLVSYLTYPRLSYYKITDISAPFWYYVTESGGVIGTLIIILITVFLLSIHFRKKTGSYSRVFPLAGIIIVSLSLSALVTNFVLKNIIRELRPSHVILQSHGITIDQADPNLINEEKYLNEPDLMDIYPPIFKSWLKESGYTFPSGHSQSSFFVATLLSFILLQVTKRRHIIFMTIPFIWAILVSISRVAIGVHYPVDIVAGAAIGFALSYLLISTKKIKQFFS